MAEVEQMDVRALAGYRKALQFENIPALETVCSLGVRYRDLGKMEGALWEQREGRGN